MGLLDELLGEQSPKKKKSASNGLTPEHEIFSEKFEKNFVPLLIPLLKQLKTSELSDLMVKCADTATEGMIENIIKHKVQALFGESAKVEVKRHAVKEERKDSQMAETAFVAVLGGIIAREMIRRGVPDEATPSELSSGKYDHLK